MQLHLHAIEHVLQHHTLDATCWGWPHFAFWLWDCWCTHWHLELSCKFPLVFVEDTKVRLFMLRVCASTFSLLFNGQPPHASSKVLCCKTLFDGAHVPSHNRCELLRFGSEIKTRPPDQRSRSDQSHHPSEKHLEKTFVLFLWLGFSVKSPARGSCRSLSLLDLLRPSHQLTQNFLTCFLVFTSRKQHKKIPNFLHKTGGVRHVLKVGRKFC